jgi:hypothetical protein
MVPCERFYGYSLIEIPNDDSVVSSPCGYDGGLQPQELIEEVLDGDDFCSVAQFVAQVPLMQTPHLQESIATAAQDQLFLGHVLKCSNHLGVCVVDRENLPEID